MSEQSNTFTYREAWLAEASRCLDKLFKERGYPLPVSIRFACGFPSTRSLNGTHNQRIGECWYANASKDGSVEVMISPVTDDPMRVMGVLVHELCHAAVGPGHGHKGPFRRIAIAMGLEGKMSATTEGEAFRQLVRPVLEHLGPYPHAALDAAKSGRKKQTTRLLKAQCSVCGYTVRFAHKWLEEIGAPHCPDHGEMEV